MTDFTFATYAEYRCIFQDGSLAIKPSGITHEEAASIPFGGMTALAFLRKADIKPGQQVLIYGASGAVGTAAIQIAKSLGAIVTGVCSTRNIELVKSLGADHVIDYTKEDFTQNGIIYDVVMETVGKLPFSTGLKSLSTNGALVLSSSLPPQMIA